MKKLIALMLLAFIGCTAVESDPALMDVPFAYTATGDDMAVGQASVVHIRVALSASELQNNWDGCTIVSSHMPWASGVKDTIVVQVSVETGVDYFFAVKIADEVPNWSGLSNIIVRNFADTTAPLPIGDFDFAD